jgi:hypothetical protein
MGEWSPENVGGRWLRGKDQGAVGARFLGLNRADGRRWRTLATVTAADPGVRFGFRVSAPVIPIAEWSFHLAPDREGCRVEEVWTDLRRGLIRPISQLRTGVKSRSAVNREGMHRTLEAIKAEAERRSG